MKAKSNTLILLVLGVILAVTQASQIFDKYDTKNEIEGLKGVNEDWNYTNEGKDWDFADCNVMTNPLSPRDLQHVTNGSMRIYQWNNYMFGFTPFYHGQFIDTDKSGIQNYVYMIYLKDDSAQNGPSGIWMSEPFILASENLVLKWHINHVRFHYPAEHTFSGVRYDMEMQIFHDLVSSPVY